MNPERISSIDQFEAQSPKLKKEAEKRFNKTFYKQKLRNSEAKELEKIKKKLI